MHRHSAIRRNRVGLVVPKPPPASGREGALGVAGEPIKEVPGAACERGRQWAFSTKGQDSSLTLV